MFSSKLRLMLMGGFILLVAAVLLFKSLGAYMQVNSFVKSATKVDGVVFRVVDGTSPSIHYPWYGFQDESGRWHRANTDLSDNVNLQVKDKVTLLYQPDHPEQAQRNEFWHLWKHAVVLASFGGAALLLGLGVLLVARTQ